MEENGEIDQSPKSVDSANNETSQTQKQQQTTKKSKGKNKKKQKSVANYSENENIDEILKSFGREIIPDTNNLEQINKPDQILLNESSLFEIEHRNLNPENELKRMFGKNILDSTERRPIKKVQRKVGNRNKLGGKLVKPRNTDAWLVGKTGKFF